MSRDEKMSSFRSRCVNPLRLDRHSKYDCHTVSDVIAERVPWLRGNKICTSCRLMLSSMSETELQAININRNITTTQDSAANIPAQPGTDGVAENIDLAPPSCHNQFQSTEADRSENKITAASYNIEDYDLSNVETLQRLSIEVLNGPDEPYSQNSTHSNSFLSQYTLNSQSTITSQSSHNTDESYYPSPAKKAKVAPQLEVDDDLLDFADAGREILAQRTEKFHQPGMTNSQKILILTLVRKSWSVRKTAKFFSTTRWMAKNAKKLVDDNGILTSPNPKKCKRLSNNVVDTVVNFYLNDNNSRELPGKKYFISVKQPDGTRKQLPKRLMYCNLNELFEFFVVKHPEVDIGFSTFAKLRPTQCIFAGASGTHSVCVCIYHENVKLMIDAADISALTVNTEHHLKKYQDLIDFTICNNPTADCHLGECDQCPGADRLASHLQNVFDQKGIDRIEFYSWTETDRATMKVNVLSSDDFVSDLCERIGKLKIHAFVAQKQSEYLDYRKAHLEPDEFIIQCDFAENYAYVAQNAVQSFHWNNDQCTLHTVVYYYKENGELRHGSIVVLSDDLQHNTVAVYAFQQKIMQHLKENLTPTKIIYFTDGATQHYKNRYNFANVLKHEEDFGVPAEWHFFGTAHEKGACDGIGGNLKRLAARASLQAVNPEDQILNPQALYNWAKKTFVKTAIIFSSKTEHTALTTDLANRFKDAQTITGTHKLHSFIPNGTGHLLLRKFSLADKFEIFPKPKKIKAPSHQVKSSRRTRNSLT